MPYTPTNWNDNVTQGNHTTLNNLETQYLEATNSFEQDLFTAFVFSGLVCTKDGTTPTQLDVTSGIAFLLQSDSTLRRRAPVASIAGQFVTATPSTTYYLFLNNDGTWTWGTTSTGPANSLAICQATTDASGNILAVTDKRALNTTLLSGMAGALKLLKINSDNGTITSDGAGSLTLGSNLVIGGTLVFGAAVSGSNAQAFYLAGINAVQIQTPQAGATALGISFGTYTGSAGAIPFSIGGQFNGAKTWVDASGNINGPGNCSIPTTRNGAAVSARVNTGANTPVSPRAGDLWFNK